MGRVAEFLVHLPRCRIVGDYLQAHVLEAALFEKILRGFEHGAAQAALAEWGHDRDIENPGFFHAREEIGLRRNPAMAGIPAADFRHEDGIAGPIPWRVSLEQPFMVRAEKIFVDGFLGRDGIAERAVIERGKIAGVARVFVDADAERIGHPASLAK